MAKKYFCPVCGYESDEPIDVCPVCGAKMEERKEIYNKENKVNERFSGQDKAF